MPFWEREPFLEIIDDGHCTFTDPGPLRSPIKTFKLRRTDKLDLKLETECGKEAVTNALLRDDSNLDEANQKATIESIGGLEIKLTGVVSELVETNENYRQDISELRETALVFGIEAELATKNEPAYTIDWLENIGRYYHWPNIVVNHGDTAFKRAYGRDPGALVLTDKDDNHSSGGAALKLTIGGIELHLTVNRRIEGTEQICPGYIIYRGTPDDEVRRKIRTILSFTLGVYLVYLGQAFSVCHAGRTRACAESKLVHRALLLAHRRLARETRHFVALVSFAAKLGPAPVSESMQFSVLPCAAEYLQELPSVST